MIPNSALSSTPISAPFLPPRTIVRASTAAGMSDVHYGGIALGDASEGLTYQLWTARIVGTDITLSAPNTPEFVVLSDIDAVWVALAMDQSAREFLAYADESGNASYYWYDSTIPGYRTSTLDGAVFRPFASLDDSRPIELSNSDVLLAYEREGELYLRAQRDRFGTEYDLGAAPGLKPLQLAQIGMNTIGRFQFAFQQSNGATILPPSEYQNPQGYTDVTQ